MSQGGFSSLGKDAISASKKLSCPIGQNLTSVSGRTLVPSSGAIAYGSDTNLLYYASYDTWYPVGTGTSAITAFINVSNQSEQTLTPVGEPGLAIISFDRPPIKSSNILFTNNNTVGITIPGIYEASYVVLSTASSEGPTYLSYGLLKTSNNTTTYVPSSSTSMLYEPFNIEGGFLPITGQSLFSALAGDTVQLFCNSGIGAVLPAPFSVYTDSTSEGVSGNINVPSLSTVISSNPSGNTDGFFVNVSYLTANNPVTSVTDSSSNTYTQIGSSPNGEITTEVWYTSFTTPQTNVTVTTDFSPSATAATMQVVNINNIDNSSPIGVTDNPFDTSTTMSGTISGSSNNYSFGLMSVATIGTSAQTITPIPSSTLIIQNTATDGINTISSASLTNFLYKPSVETISATIPVSQDWVGFILEIINSTSSALFPDPNANLIIKLISSS